jgi:UDP-N-acetylglucosamine--N-acetylmuramyl-(pentapeptide) pyrophosphoryl-undecaprenol N-acetylglucosamine transferase
MNRVLFAGGGTAGHIEPAWAVSQVWRKRFPGDEIAFLGTKNGQELEVIPERGGTLYLIPKVPAPRKLNIKTLVFPIELMVAVFKTIQIVKRFDVVVGFGGYVSASAYLAAIFLRKPIVLHDQNAKLGMANKLGSIFAKEVLLAYESSDFLKENKKVKVVGNPLKSQIVTAAKSANGDWSKARAQAKEQLKVNGRLLLVLGGSTGSVAINQVLFDALKESDETLKDCTVIHSLGRSNQLPSATDKYRPISYIEDMASVLLASDLVISRSGAIATTEFAALGKYALFVPLPIGNGEQAQNARELVSAGKAEIIEQQDFTARWLLANLQRLLTSGTSEAYGTNLNADELIADAISRTLAGESK